MTAADLDIFEPPPDIAVSSNVDAPDVFDARIANTARGGAGTDIASVPPSIAVPWRRTMAALAHGEITSADVQEVYEGNYYLHSGH